MCGRLRNGAARIHRKVDTMNRKTISVLLLALVLALSFSTTALAAGSATATVPITLTVANEYRAVNVTLPAFLPVHVINGTVVVADNVGILNNSKSDSSLRNGWSIQGWKLR